MPKDYMPRGEQELASWAAAYKLQLSNQARALNLDPSQVANATQVIDLFLQDFNDSESQKDIYRAAVAKKDASKTAMVSLLRLQANVIKNSPNYTEAAGAMLGIIPNEPSAANNSALKPIPKISKSVQGVSISYIKKRMDGVMLYCRRGNETTFTLLDKFTRNVCEDRRPNLNNAPAELREYYLVYFKNDQPIGQASDITNITV